MTTSQSSGIFEVQGRCYFRVITPALDQEVWVNSEMLKTHMKSQEFYIKIHCFVS